MGRKVSMMNAPTPRFLLATFSALCALAIAPQALAATKNVNIRKGGFSPGNVSINVGDSIRWTNRDTVNHQVVANSGAFVSPILRPNQSWSFVFEAAGGYPYRDALEPAERGMVKVQGPPPSVSIAASIPIIVYGKDVVTLAGGISNRRAGERVEIFHRPHPQTSYVKLAEVLTQANGAWSYVTRPEILTNYQVHWRNRTSAEVSVAVRPRISFGRRTGWFITRVFGNRSFAGRTVHLQRLSRFGQWVTVKRVGLGSQSARRFKRKMPKGTSRLRIFMTVNQAGDGYLGGMSTPITFRRR
jgi:plastocyanin